MAQAKRMPWWAWAWPLLAWMVLAAAAISGVGGTLAAAAGASLVLTVFAAVYHAEVVAHRVGEPFGTLVLAVAVTVIEVALIVWVMVGSTADKSGLARDTVFAAVPGLSGVTAVAAGDDHSLALLSNGTVMAWGDGQQGQLGNGGTDSSAVPVPCPGRSTKIHVRCGRPSRRATASVGGGVRQ